MGINRKSDKNFRWWEFYLVRYLLGTLLGTIIVSYIISSNGVFSQYISLTNNKMQWFDILKGNYFVFIIIGFAYCYLSSAPILVFHANRNYFKSSEKEELNVVSKICILIVSTLAIAFCIIYMFYDYSKYFVPFRYILLFITILIQMILILMNIFKNKISKFYDKLTEVRKIERMNQYKDSYIESYKHLREHGNAFSIILTEFLLAFIIIDIESFNKLIATIVLWIIPAAMVWILGTILEINLFKN